MIPVEPIGPRLRMLPGDVRPDIVRRYAVDEAVLLLAPADMPSDDLVRHGIAGSRGGWPPGWTVDRDRSGAPMIRSGGDRAPGVSLAATRCTRAVLIGGEPLGIDIETTYRVAANARSDDDWLAPQERLLLADLPPGDRLVELACRWVLREAYGKASRRGLDLPLSRLAFTIRGGGIALQRSVLDGDIGWKFALHRAGPCIIGIVAARSAGQPVGARR